MFKSGFYATHILVLEGARGIEPPPRFSDGANGFEDRGVPSTIAPEYCGIDPGFCEYGAHADNPDSSGCFEHLHTDLV
jgi:hypothetical protein